MDAEEKSLEDVAVSLIREFLCRKGLKLTLKCLDHEFNQEENYISDRQELIQELHLEKLVKKNKISSYPLKTLLEVIIRDLQTKREKATSNINNKQNKKETINKKTKNLQLPIDNDNFSQDDIKIKATEVDLKNCLNFQTELNTQEDIEYFKKSFQTSLDCDRFFTFTKNSEKKDEATNIISGIESSVLTNSEIKNLSNGYLKPKLNNNSSKGLETKAQFGLVHSSLENPSRQRRRALYKESSEVNSLKNKIASNNLCSDSKNILEIKPEITKIKYSEDKKTTSFKSSTDRIINNNTKDMDDLQLCDLSDSEVTFQPINKISSKKKTASRPITISEACELKKLLFGNTSAKFGPEWRGQAFIFNEFESVCYGLVQNKGGPCGILAAVQSHILLELLFHNYQDFCVNGCLRPTTRACKTSLIRTLSKILWKAGLKQQAIVALPSGRQVIDVTTSLAAKLQYDGLTEQYQEMVNLMVIGEAVSNVFDNNLELNTGGTEKTILHGIHSVSDIGLLSLFEHYNSCEVGKNLKNPNFPVWIVLSESHFSVLFATSLEETKSGRLFHLFYYDGLLNQNEEIRLTVDPMFNYVSNEDDLVSPIDHCIRTKWNGAKISWNIDPLL
ncbi:probable ubiquitin carboxyl-terminal hydrolase MINDY-4 [Centruroides sculpturatus]|uniref:probable ubiquitin carboxyl-terminal hydrolase MINDY-4 n=1 Tax=Centruroides sculpturatus TaxID=218467 RepID=UPI000C6D618A|nr:probable ubiquitin carboxyl-terminal hydrolase MINDY-4 [Centruroides sculpturatus]